MEGLRVSKLEEGQQWGKNTSSKDKVQWGRRPPFIGGEKSNRYAHSPHRAVLPLQGAVLLLRVVVLLLAGGTKKLHPQQPLLRTPKLTQHLQTDSEFDETKFVGKLATRANTILIEISIRRKCEKAQNKLVRTLPRIRPVKPPTPKTS